MGKCNVGDIDTLIRGKNGGGQDEDETRTDHWSLIAVRKDGLATSG